MLKKTFLFMLYISYFIFLFYYFSQPFVGPYGHSHLQYSIAARNYLEEGWGRFIPYVLPNQAYLNHPPLLYIILSIFYKIFGYSEFIGRLMPFLFSLGSAFFFYLLIKTHFGKKIAIYSLIFYLTFPMFLFYGGFIQFEPLVLFFLLGSFYLLTLAVKNTPPSQRNAPKKHRRAQNLIFIVLSSLFLVLSFLTDFSGLIFAFLLIIYLIIKKRSRLALLFFILYTVYCILYTRYLFSVGFSLSSLFSAYSSRATLKEIANFGFVFKFISIIFLRLFIYFSPLVLFVFPLITQLLKYSITKNGWVIIILLFLFPVLNCVLLFGGTYTHPYFLFFFIPIIAFLCGYFLFRHKKWINFFLIIHFLWSAAIFSLKIYQIKKFFWQYLVARKTAEIIGKDKVFYKNWALDKELFYWYDKKVPMEIYPPELLAKKKYQSNYYLFVCFPQCQKSDYKFLKDLSKKFSWQKINVKIPSYIFCLKEKPISEKIILVKGVKKTDKYLEFLRGIKGFFNVDQL